jgi:hypothetical protein
LASTGNIFPELGRTIHYKYTAKVSTFSADRVSLVNGAYQLGEETPVAVQLTGPDAAEWHPTFKLGDARPLIYPLVKWV